ncbi:MAG: UDP-N-acetylglucosamine 1-carboxyvinyltransferase [Actinomycetota bacterium]
MERFVVRGGRPLTGRVKIAGAKNSALKLLAATLSAPGEHLLHRVPDVADIRVTLELLRTMGAEATLDQAGTARVVIPDDLEPVAPYELARQMRASIIVLGPLLGRFGRAQVAMPGGCNIGARKIDMHLAGLEKMGATIGMEHGDLVATGSLRGANIVLDWPSHGATENLLMAATLAKGNTVIDNAARDPEISDLAQMLRAMGAKIHGDGTHTLEIEGVDALHGSTHTTIPDRLEAGTYLIACAAVGGSVRLEGARADHLELLLSKLGTAGATIDTDDTSVSISIDERPRAVDIVTLPYPGFPTDLQPQWISLLAVAEGTGIVTENVFEGRFSFIGEMARLGADIRTEGHHAVVRGVPSLSAAPVEAPDIRAGAALVIAGLCAEGETTVAGVELIDRGYEALEESFRGLGADIVRESIA